MLYRKRRVPVWCVRDRDQNKPVSMLNMIKPFKQTVAILACVAVAGFYFTQTSTAQVKKGKKQPLTTAQWMSGVVKPNCGALKKGLDAGPKSDDDWDKLAMYAAILNESSYVLMADGRCPDGTWAKASTKSLRGGSAGVLKAIDARDVDGAKAAFKQLTSSCAGCHKAHKPKK